MSPDGNLLIEFLNNHFEAICAGLIFWLIVLVTIITVAALRNLPRRVWTRGLRTVVDWGLLGGSSLMMGLIIYNFLINETPKPALDFEYRVLPTTEWVREDLDIYFIHERELVRVHADGTDRRVIFQSPDLVRSYHFSPDGRWILITTEQNLFLLDRQTAESRRIDTCALPTTGPQAKKKGVIDGVSWSPQSRRFCYHVARWTDFSSVDQWWVYDLAGQTRQPIHSPSLTFPELMWGTTGETLYAIWHEARDPERFANPYQVKVYEIPLATLRPRLTHEFPSDEPHLSAEHLALRDIQVYTGAEGLSFGRDGASHYSWRSQQGARLGIDESDRLYVIKNRWWKRRLYRIPRVPVESDIDRYQHDGGRLAVQYLHWLPSGRYVIMEHHFLGALIMEPASGKIGLLVNEKGNTFGWYP